MTEQDFKNDHPIIFFILSLVSVSMMVMVWSFLVGLSARITWECLLMGWRIMG